MRTSGSLTPVLNARETRPSYVMRQPDILRWYFRQFYDGLFYNEHPGMTIDVRTKELLRLELSSNTAVV